MAQALSPTSSISVREQSAINVAAAAINAQPDALEMALDHVAQYPNDVFVLAHLIGPFGLLAFSGEVNWRERNVELVKQVKQSFASDDWWYSTSAAFLYAEVGDLQQAHRLADKAWLQLENGNTAHTLAHVYYEQSNLEQAQDFLDDWLIRFGAKSDMRHHLLWHQILTQLDQGEEIDLLTKYEKELHATVCDPMPLSTFSDNASVLWRCVLMGGQVPGSTCNEVLEYASQYFPDSGFVFSDVHRAIMLAGAGQIDPQVWDQSPAWLKCFAGAFVVFVQANYKKAVELLEQHLQQVVLLGGSNAQRRLIEDTYIEACVRSGLSKKALGFLQQRNRKTPFDRKLIERIS